MKHRQAWRIPGYIPDHYQAPVDTLDRRVTRKYPPLGSIKNEDEEGYPLSDFEEPPRPKEEPVSPDKYWITMIKRDPKFSDSDQGEDNSDDDTYPQPNVKKFDSSPQVGVILSQIVKHQAAMQDQNLKVMQQLVSRSTNAFVLDDILVFDGNSKYSVVVGIS